MEFSYCWKILKLVFAELWCQWLSWLSELLMTQHMVQNHRISRYYVLSHLLSCWNKYILTMILLALLPFEDLICWNDRYIYTALFTSCFHWYLPCGVCGVSSKSCVDGKPYNSATSTTYRSLYKILSGGTLSGADPGFQVRGGALKKIAPSGGRKINTFYILFISKYAWYICAIIFNVVMSYDWMPYMCLAVLYHRHSGTLWFSLFH